MRASRQHHHVSEGGVEMTTTAYREDTVDVRGYQVPVKTGGSGPPLLYLHGAGRGELWTEAHEALARSFTVHAPVHPGFSGTPLPDWVRGVDDVALHYVDLIRELRLARPLVVGFSIGGWIATELAVFRPDLLGGLVLVDAIGVRPEQPLPDLFIMDPGEAMGYLFSDPSKALALAPAGPPDADMIVRAMSDQAASARLMWKRPYNPKLRRRLHHITVPTFVIWGEQDRFVPADHGRMLAAEIPDARFHLIERAGHVVPIEAPEAMADAVRDFASTLVLGGS